MFYKLGQLRYYNWGKCYYKIEQLLQIKAKYITNWGSFVLLHIRANVVTNWGSFVITN